MTEKESGGSMNGGLIAVSFRAVLLSVILIGFVAVMLHISTTSNRPPVGVAQHAEESTRADTARESEHAAIRNDLQLLAVILTYDQSDRDRVRGALLPQLSPSVRLLIESAERAREEKALTKRGTVRQPDESPDSAARERPRAPRRNGVQSP